MNVFVMYVRNLCVGCYVCMYVIYVLDVMCVCMYDMYACMCVRYAVYVCMLCMYEMRLRICMDVGYACVLCVRACT